MTCNLRWLLAHLNYIHHYSYSMVVTIVSYHRPCRSLLIFLHFLLFLAVCNFIAISDTVTTTCRTPPLREGEYVEPPELYLK
jgi:hypothetical protein